MFTAPSGPARWPRLLFAVYLVVACGTIFAANNPVPFIDLPVVPAAAVPGGAGFTLTVNGTGFVSGSVVNWNGSPRTTTFISAAQVTAAILASDIAIASTGRITVSNPAPGGGTSSVAYFEVTTPVSSVTLAGLQVAELANFNSPIVADLNHDGKLDLIVFLENQQGENPYVALGNGDGTFSAALPILGGLVESPGDSVLADFNKDGNLDIALRTCCSVPSTVSILLGNGDGTFQPPMFTGSQNNTVYNRLAVGDFNQDGNLDLVTNYANPPDSGISVLLGNGDGTFQAPVNYSLSPFPRGVLLVGDFNGDGKLDLTMLNSSDASTEIGTLLGNGDGTFQPLVLGFSSSGEIFVQNVSVADVNGDGKQDLLLWINEDHPVFFDAEVQLGNGDGTFQPPSGSAGGNAAFPPGDFNGDGKLDFVTSAGQPPFPADDLSIWAGNGDGTFDNPVAIQTSTGLPLTPLRQGDFNGDGTQDLLAQDSKGGFWLFLQGSFGSGTPSPAGLNFGQGIDTISPGQAVTFTNTGNLPLTLSPSNITGTNESEFQETNNCPTSLPVGAKCQITVTFSPAAVGNRSATLNIPNNGIGNKAVPLSGVGTDFSISEPMPNSVTVVAGQTAQYLFEVDPIDGFEGGVNLTCSETPAGAKCLPALATLNGSAGIKVTFKIETTARTNGMNRGMFAKNGRWLASGLFGLPLIVSLVCVGVRRRGQVHRWMFLVLMTAAISLLPACGGGSGGGGGGGGSGTPAGTYPLTVTGEYTSGGKTLTHTTTLTLVVE